MSEEEKLALIKKNNQWKEQQNSENSKSAVEKMREIVGPNAARG